MSRWKKSGKKSNMDSDIAKVKYKVDESHKKDKTKCSAQEKWVDGQRKNLYTKSS